ncbi:MAG: hypothetical protein K9N46_15635 [Candidatus Marinimicrobia bacterium]|nr:hypothetical protein [Candidatus Neomarinimicrobiota bacterium]MCF7830364.1 hypothetical protein [Candidatus Neomarinimicrobiota bacterium]MCF7882162.1 hypothetical protein [Candidatus Neomarinimicrobiota bacterium]
MQYKQIGKMIGAGVLLLGILYLAGCSDSENPMESDANASTHTVTVQVEPPSFLRTETTSNLWQNPVEIDFTVDPQNLGKVNHEDDGSDWQLIDTRHLNDMGIDLVYGGGRDLYSMGAGGMMNRHHPDEDSHHFMVHVYEDSVMSAGSTGMPIMAGSATLQAMSGQDTFTYQLEPVMGEHGYRYESNTALAPGTYDLRLRINPPDFYRTEATQDFWTTPVNLEFASFAFDSSYAPQQIGSKLFATEGGDSLGFGLYAERPASFASMDSGWRSLSGDETIRFALDISVPWEEFDHMPMYDTNVHVTVRNNRTGEIETKSMQPVYGGQGFYYGENMMTEIMGDHMGGGMHGGM